jgi:predicted  nucleic acid-binding Zn-ribbon protein
MPDIYKKIEKRIVNLKEKEELWKGRYREMAQRVKELSDSTSERMKQMENSIRNFNARMEEAEAQTRKANERAEEVLRLLDRKITQMSESAKGIYGRIEESEEQIKKLRSEIVSQVSSMMAKHEKTFDSVLGKIGLATKSIESELKEGEGLYGRMEATKRFMENYTPPEPSRMNPPMRANNSLDLPAEDLSFVRSQLKPPMQQPIPRPPAPERFESESSLIYGQDSQISSPQNFMRLAPRKPIHMDDLDDDMDVDDLISGNMRGFKDSVESMNSSVSGISEKLASIEEKVAKMQTVKNPNLERLDDKIRMYSQSVADIHSRMETVEKALRDGMTPMMESLKLLTDSVKSLKEESRSRPVIQKPKPPAHPAMESMLIPTKSNRTPSTFQRIHVKKITKPPSDLGVSYG